MFKLFLLASLAYVSVPLDFIPRVPGFDAQGHPVADPDTGEQVEVDRFALIEGIDNPVWDCKLDCVNAHL